MGDFSFNSKAMNEEKIKEYIKFPLKVSEDGETIQDADGAKVLEMAGWGWIKHLDDSMNKALWWMNFVKSTLNDAYTQEKLEEGAKRVRDNGIYGSPGTYQSLNEKKGEEAAHKFHSSRIDKLEKLLFKIALVLDDLPNQRTLQGRTYDIVKEIKEVLGRDLNEDE